ncbi:MAG TPA: HRDC domain-containing protein, partial [Anaerolineales bacterium]|nr:HRDC domain-containing protein [Anaerolineales bacterium]
ARLDTHYLFNLRDVLEGELIKKDRLIFAKEDFTRACRFEESKQKINGESWGRFAGRKDLSLRELTILAYLCKWRDREAEKLNRPPYKVIMDDVFVLMSKNPPENKVDLSAMGLSEKQIGLWGDSVLAAVRRGIDAPLVERKQAEAKNDAVLRRLEKLKLWRKNIGLEMGVESDIILPKPYLSALAENPPMNTDELAHVMKDSPSRVEKYGAQILKILGVKNAN